MQEHGLAVHGVAVIRFHTVCRSHRAAAEGERLGIGCVQQVSAGHGPEPAAGKGDTRASVRAHCEGHLPQPGMRLAPASAATAPAPTCREKLPRCQLRQWRAPSVVQGQAVMRWMQRSTRCCAVASNFRLAWSPARCTRAPVASSSGRSPRMRTGVARWCCGPRGARERG